MLAAAPAPALTLESLGHSSLVVTSDDGVRVLVDPYADNEWPGLDFPTVHADLVLVTHPHWDHDAWRSVWGDPKVMQGPGTMKRRDVVVRGFEGRHADVGGASIDWRNTVYVIETGGVRLCHLGDNGPVPGSPGLADAIGPVDVLMLPVDAERRVLSYDEAAAWIEALSPRIVVPIHYRIPVLSLENITGIGTIDGWLASLPEGLVWQARGPGPVELKPDSLPQAGQRHVWLLLRQGQKAPGRAPLPSAPAAAQQARERADIALAQGDVATALQNLLIVVAALPHDAEALHRIGFLYLDARRPDRALEFFRKGTAGDTRAASLCRLGSGMALDLLGRREEAIDAYRDVIALGINDDLQVDNARRWLEGPYAED